MLKIIPRILLTFGAVLVLGCALRGQDTIEKLDIIPDGGGTIGRIKFIESTGFGGIAATQGISLKAPASIASDFDWTFPNANPGATNCLEVTTGGVIQYAAGACGVGGGGAPFVDTTSIVEGSVDATKEIRFEVDGLTTGTIRVLTPQNANYILAGTNINNSFSGEQNFAAATFTSTVAFQGTGNDYELDRSSAEGFIIARSGGDDIVEVEEISTVLNEVRFQAGSGASDDVIVRWVNSTAANGYQFLWDQSLDDFVLQNHAGTLVWSFDGATMVFNADLDPDNDEGQDGGSQAKTWDDWYVDRLLVSEGSVDEIVLDSRGSLNGADQFIINNTSGTNRIKMGVANSQLDAAFALLPSATSRNISLTTLASQSGPALYMADIKVVGTQCAALPADATDLTTAIALVNAIKDCINVNGHGLAAGT